MAGRTPLLVAACAALALAQPTDVCAATGIELWLLFAMPTVPRSSPSARAYLGRTLDHVVAQLPASPAEPTYGRVGCLVVNMRPGEHTEFEVARARYAHVAAISFEDVRAADAGDTVGSAAAAPPMTATAERHARIRRHTRDVASLLRHAHGRSRLLLLLDDDVRLCPLALLAIQHFVRRADTRDADWLSMRVSYASSGVLLHNNNEDVPALADHLVREQASHPQDHLTTLFMLGFAPSHLPPPMAPSADGLPLAPSLRLGSGDFRRQRTHFAARYNLFEQFGAVSTLRPEEQSPGQLRCYDFLGVPALFIEECFALGQCPTDDLSPCDGHVDDGASLPQLFDWRRACASHPTLA